MQNSPPRTQTISLLWRARRRGRAEGPAGHSRTLAAGQEVTGLSPNAPVRPAPLRAAPRGWHVARLGGRRVPPAPSAPRHLRVPSPAGATSPMADGPKRIRGRLSAKPPDSGVFVIGKVAASRVGLPCRPSDGEVTWDTPAPSGTSPVVALVVSGIQATARDPGRASTATKATSAPDVGYALASPRRSGSAAGPGGASGRRRPQRHQKGAFPGARWWTVPRPPRDLLPCPLSALRGRARGTHACPGDTATYTGVGACP